MPTVISVLRDKRFLAFDLNALDAFPPDDGLKSMREALQHAIVFRNPPDHTRLRRLMTTFFSPAVVNGLEPKDSAHRRLPARRGPRRAARWI